VSSRFIPYLSGASPRQFDESMTILDAPDSRRHGDAFSRGLPRAADGWAIFLDFDGTLVDIAPTPAEVNVPPELPHLLARVAARAGGALALLTGRPIAVIDSFLAPLRLPMGGIHGAEIRFPGGAIARAEPSAALTALRTRLQNFVARRPGLLLEDKGIAFAVHYRAAPELRAEVERELFRMAEETADLAAQEGKMVVELRPVLGVKDEGLHALLARPPFTGLRPIAIGDDRTDEPMFAAANDEGGMSVLVGPRRRDTHAQLSLASPAAVRDWLASLLEN
jgi:trehalose 6-phosphate phosphatase